MPGSLVLTGSIVWLLDVDCNDIVVASDVDECATNTDTCTDRQICINVYGGYRCLDDVTYTSG